jgi:hypothetical protein
VCLPPSTPPFSLQKSGDVEIMKPHQLMMPKTAAMLRQDKNTHWSLKTISDMTERDWRIFKVKCFQCISCLCFCYLMSSLLMNGFSLLIFQEDFSISMRGTRIPFPIRSWDEANIPAALRKGTWWCGNNLVS